jgi:hypothetical protein
MKSKGIQSSIEKTIQDAWNKGAGPQSVESQKSDCFQMALVATCMQKGINFEQLDAIRAVLNKYGEYKLQSTTTLKQKFIPTIHHWETENIKSMLKGKFFSLAHDGATRGKQVLAVVVRCLERNEKGCWEYVQHLIRLKYLRKDLNTLSLAGEQAMAMTRLGLSSENLVYTCCDGCATNIAASRKLKEFEQYAHVYMALCVSHFGNNTGVYFLEYDLPCCVYICTWRRRMSERKRAREREREREREETGERGRERERVCVLRGYTCLKSSHLLCLLLFVCVCVYVYMYICVYKYVCR